MGNVTITKAEYDKMNRELSKLSALEAGGVDNWEWFDESLTEWRKENEFDEMMESLLEDFVELVDELSIEAEVDYPAGMEAGSNVHVPRDDEQARAFIMRVIEKHKEMEGK
tara:strand:+ start:199 stop:531 length:333 start_codon:yes stop_codon:yes gene_type:complete